LRRPNTSTKFFSFSVRLSSVRHTLLQRTQALYS
jgi:hypothetical protein